MTDDEGERSFGVIVDEVDVALHEVRDSYGDGHPHVTFANACEIVKIRAHRELAVEIYNSAQSLKP